MGLLSRINPIALLKTLEPSLLIYDKEIEVINSVEENDETYVLSANKMGKDWTAARVVVLAALRCIKLGLTFRIVTTSVKDDHLDILWGEIHQFINQSAYPLNVLQGGPLAVLKKEIRHASERNVEKPVSYVKGMVSETGEGMSGHHAQFTMLVGDEASAMDDLVYSGAQGWAKKMLFLSNANPCENFFRKACDGGDVKRVNGTGLIRKVIHLPAEESPNVKFALWQRSQGIEPTNDTLIPGVLEYDNGMLGYVERRKHWDKQRQCIGLDAQFYEGPELRLFPQEWLQHAKRLAVKYRGMVRKAKAIGVDPAEGGDKTCYTVVDELGVIEQLSYKTPDTDVIPRETLALMRKYGVPSERVCFDRGGGGKQAADRLRAMGWDVRTVDFGDHLTLDPKRGIRLLDEKLDNREERGAYKNRRVEMYWELSLAGDIGDGSDPKRIGFAIPHTLEDLLFQLSKIPKLYDEHGHAFLPPKHRQPHQQSKQKTLVEIIGRSPDEADSLVLAYHAMTHRQVLAKAGAI